MDFNAVIPEGIEFSDLKLERDTATGHIHFEWEPIEAICKASGVDVRTFTQEACSGNVVHLILSWHQFHVDTGGAPDPVIEDWMEEARLKEERGGGFVYPAGHA